MACVLLFVSFLQLRAQGFYLPGVAPREYIEGEIVDLKVNKLESGETQLPYAYYALPFCRPPQIALAAENLGEVLTGEVIENSVFEVDICFVFFAAFLKASFF